MANISGKLGFSADRMSLDAASLPGIANVPIILQNLDSGEFAVVNTAADGTYSFTNVPNGQYQIIEKYGTPSAATGTVDWSGRAAGERFSGGTVPPVSFAPGAPAGATNLDNLIPNTRIVTVLDNNLVGQGFVNGPVVYTPIQTIMDSGVVVSPVNLIISGANGTFGSFNAGTAANTGADPNPYPDIGSEFIYTLPNPDGVTPADGFYTIQNIMNDATAAVQNTWWRIADHTTGNEIGRMMVVNGHNPGAVIFQQKVQVTANTYYLLSSWILNLSKSASLVDPQLGVQVLDANGQVLYASTLGALIPRRTDMPEWKQIGTVINSGNNSEITVQFVSMGPAAVGNDYAIDDIALREITLPPDPPAEIIKSADASSVLLDGTVTYSVQIRNTRSFVITDINFQDTVPQGFTFINGSVILNGTPLPAANPNTGFVIPDLEGGQTATITFRASATAVPPVNPTLNTAGANYRYSPVQGGIPINYSSVSNEVSVIINPVADLSVIKTASETLVFPGQAITYEIKITNAGPSPTVPTLSDVLPLQLVSPSAQVNGVWGPWNGSAVLNELAAGETATVYITGTVNAIATGTLNNTAVVTGSAVDPNPNNNSSSVVTPIGNLADVSIFKSVSPSEVASGQNINFSLVVSNSGPSAADNVTVTDNIPAEILNPEFSVDFGATWNPWTGSYNIGTLPSDSVIRVQIRGTISGTAALGTVTNTATVSSTTEDPDPTNNTSTTTFNIVQTPDVPASADLAVTKTANPSPVIAGQIITYTITVNNNGPDPSEGVSLIDAIPAMVQGSEFSLDNGTTWSSWSGQTNLGTINNGASVTVLIRGTVNSAAMGEINNTATVVSSTGDPNLENNRAQILTPIESSADLAMQKTSSPNPVNVGGVLTYTLTVKNNGPSFARGAVFTDAIGTELSAVQFSSDGGLNWLPWTGSYSAGDMSNGSSVLILIRGTVAPNINSITNTAIVSAVSPDPDPSNNTSTITTGVINQADLAIVKSVNEGIIQAGSSQLFILSIRNNGPSTATGVLVSDTLPAQLSNAIYSLDGITWLPFTNPVNIGSLANGEKIIMLLKGTIAADAMGTFTNTANISSAVLDPDLSNNTSSVVFNVFPPPVCPDCPECPECPECPDCPNPPIPRPSADLSVVTSVYPFGCVCPCTTLTYTIVVSNAGPDAARDVILTNNILETTCNTSYSVDFGRTFNPWTGGLPIGTLAPNNSLIILLRGRVLTKCSFVNISSVTSTTTDPNLSNNYFYI